MVFLERTLKIIKEKKHLKMNTETPQEEKSLEKILVITPSNKIKEHIPRLGAYDFKIAKDDEEASEYLKDNLPQVIFANSEEETGFFEKLIQDYPDIPVIFFSDNPSAEQGRTLIQNGAFDYVPSDEYLLVSIKLEEGIDEHNKRKIKREVKYEFEPDEQIGDDTYKKLEEGLGITGLREKVEEEVRFYHLGEGGRRKIENLKEAEALGYVLTRGEVDRRLMRMGSMLGIPDFVEKIKIANSSGNIKNGLLAAIDTVVRKGRGFFNHLYIIAGPTGVGKTEICERLRRKFSEDTTEICVKPTDRPRRKDEADGVDHVFVNKWSDKLRDTLSLEFKAYGFHYGIPREFESRLREGNDGLLIVSNYDVFEKITKHFDGRFHDGFVVPVLLYADKQYLMQRLKARESDVQQISQRTAKLDEELDSYANAHELFKYVILNNSRFYREEDLSDTKKIVRLNEVVSRLVEIINVERETEGKKLDFSVFHENYIKNLVDTLFGKSLLEISKAVGKGEDVRLVLEEDKDMISEYSEKKRIPPELINAALHKKILCVTNAYGRLGLFFERFEEPNVYNYSGGKEIMLGIISEALKTYPAAELKKTDFKEFSGYGLVRIPGTGINDGSFYSLTYDFKLPELSKPFHALSIGFINNKPRKGYHPLEPVEIRKMKRNRRQIYQRPDKRA
ncbi:AAA family ATPase [Candidatus Woesearchaeota archaeon]|nr:AAA family ATPase [Candidatus Woesearchaeota archaeon]